MYLVCIRKSQKPKLLEIVKQQYLKHSVYIGSKTK